MQSKQRMIYCSLALILGTFLVAGNLSAQLSQKDGMQGPLPLPDSIQIVKLVHELAMTISSIDDQKSHLLDLHFAHFKEAGELQQEYKGNREGHRKAMDVLKEEFIEEIKQLLTEDQVEEYEEFLKNHEKQRRGKKPKRR